MAADTAYSRCLDAWSSRCTRLTWCCFVNCRLHNTTPFMKQPCPASCVGLGNMRKCAVALKSLLH